MERLLSGLVRISNRLGLDLPEFIRYFVASFGALAIDLGLLFCLVEVFGVHYLTSAIISFLVGMLFVYALSVGWVFNHRAIRNNRLELAIFVAIGIAGLALNGAIMWTGTEAAGLPYQWSKVISVAVVFLFNFTMRKALLFSVQRLSKEARV